MNEIQELRKELAKLIREKVIPMRDKLDVLLNEEAKKICPFKIGELIVLENGKKGKITDIKYLSLNYEFSADTDPMFDFLPKLDEIEYRYAYSIDNKEFSITWGISGLRLNKEDKIGKVRFADINPIYYLIDKEGKRITRKDLNNHMEQDYISLFGEI